MNSSVWYPPFFRDTALGQQPQRDQHLGTRADRHAADRTNNQPGRTNAQPTLEITSMGVQLSRGGEDIVGTTRADDTTVEFVSRGLIMRAHERATATTPGPSSFAALARALIRTKHPNAAPGLADDVLTMPPNTLKTLTTAWNNWLRWCTDNRWPPLSPSPSAMLAHIRSIAARSTRPGGSTKQCRIMFNFLADIDTTFDVTLPPTTVSSASQWIPRTLFLRAVKGVVRRGTTATTKKQPYLDMWRVLESLKVDTAALDAVNLSSMSPAHYRRRRDVAIASFAAMVPSRPAELAGLELNDVTLYVPTTVLGVRAMSARLHEVSSEFLRQVVSDLSINFHLVIELRRSKTDAALAGIPKRLQHAPGATWSSARAVLAAVLDGRRLLGATSTGAPSRRAPLFHDTTSPPLSSQPLSLSASTISSLLARRALAATGTEGISGRGWRPAAASWLLACGVDKSTVVALGGWASAKSLRSFYVRHLPLTPEQLNSVLSILPTTMSKRATNTTNTDGADATAAGNNSGADDDPTNDSTSSDNDDDDTTSDDDTDDEDDDDDDSDWEDSSDAPRQRLVASRRPAEQRAQEEAARKELTRRSAHLARLS